MLQTRERTRGAPKIRIPLDHPETEQISKRIRFLIFSGMLSEDECGRLTKWQRELRKADSLLSRILYDRPLPATELRPLFYDYKGPFLSGSQAEVATGWVFRLREYVEKLERKYSVGFDRASNVVGDDDI